MNQQFLIGKFWDPEMVMDALKKFKQDDVLIYDVFSPFPIHGIEPYLNIKRSRLTVAAFIYGAMGLMTALLLMGVVYGVLWPMDIGGKPSLAWPSFVPITFELTVLFAAHGMVITFFIVARYWPGKKAVLMDDRQTDDIFVIAIDKSKIENEAAVREVLNKYGAYEVTEKVIDPS